MKQIKIQSKMIVALTGGIGGTKLILGFSKLLSKNQLTVIGNTGDDLELFGLRICPDLDTVTYTLGNLVNTETGWGMKDDSFICLNTLKHLGEPSWFNLGDRDLATHLWRTSLIKQGNSLSQITEKMCQILGVNCRLLPMTDSYTPTYLMTSQGKLHLQEYLIREKCNPVVQELIYENIQNASPSPGISEAILNADGVIICPSNPFISIGPILAVPGIRELLIQTDAPIFAITPIVNQKACKGPTAKMLEELDYPVSPVTIATLYRDFLDIFVLDNQDVQMREEIETMGLKVVVTNTVMNNNQEKTRLANELLEML